MNLERKLLGIDCLKETGSTRKEKNGNLGNVVIYSRIR